MNWEDIVKAPPRPYTKGKFREFGVRQPVSEYGMPRALGQFKVSKDEMNLTKEFEPLITYNPYMDKSLDDTSIFTELQEGRKLTLREIQQEVSEEGLLDAGLSMDEYMNTDTTLLIELHKITTSFFDIYEQMLDDLYDHFEAWKAWVGWNKFIKTYHMQEVDGRESYKYDEPAKLSYIKRGLDDLSKHVELAKTNKYYNDSEFVNEMVSNVEKGINDVRGLIDKYEQ